jgi:flavin reductase (DIM6/NTAB) family NADH-FMN oxidoreductase RutF
MIKNNYTQGDIENMKTRFRTNFINSLSGFKSANLIGTANETGLTNLAVFSSVVHIGANPALLGFISRPHSTPRHTLENILATKYFTINSIAADFIAQAHQTSARYQISEFEATGLTAEYRDGFFAPFVQEAVIKIGLSLADIIDISLNDTKLVIGKIECLYLPENIILADGNIDLEAAETVTISSLDTYHRTQKIARFPYAKP